MALEWTAASVSIQHQQYPSHETAASAFDTIQLAFRLAFIRRNNPTSDDDLPPIRSLAYFRAVALNLSPQERDPAYLDYVRNLYEQLRAPQTEASADTSNKTRAE